MSIGRNAAYNLAGFTVPLVLFLVTIPIYIDLIGAARYGVLAIVWLVLGLFGMMDLGLGRAATQRVAALKNGTAQERRGALGTALTSNLVIGAIGAAIMAVAAWFMFARGMKLDADLRAEAMPLVPLMAIGVPIVTTLAILSGALMGREKFFIVNRITITNTSLFQLAPLAVAWLAGPTLVWLVLAALAARLLAVLLLWRECRKEFGAGAIGGWDATELVRMLRYGGWVTAGGMIGMVLVFSDRFLIGAAIGAVAVTVYAVPLDATRRIAVVADALANALFPRLAVLGKEESRKLTRQAVGALYAIATPPVAVLIVLADPLMRAWLGEDLGARSAPLLQILAIAGWANIFAKVPYARLQAQGRPDVVTKIMLAQLPIYLPALWFALEGFGLAGAAWVYLARNSVDTLALFLAAERRVDHGMMLALTFAAMVAAALILPQTAPIAPLRALAYAAPVALASMLAAWLLAPPRIREFAFGLLRRLPLARKG